MKKLIIYSILIIFPILIFSGCQFARQADVEEKVVEKEKVEQEKQEQEEIDTSDWKKCENKDLEIKLKYPNEWGDCYIDREKFNEFINSKKSKNDFSKDPANNYINKKCGKEDDIFIIKTDDENSNVYLYISFCIEEENVDLNNEMKICKNSIKNNEHIVGAKCEKKDNIGFIEIREIGVSGDGVYHNVIIENRKFYIEIDTLSDQGPPEGWIDGICHHTTNIGKGTDWNIIKSIERIN